MGNQTSKKMLLTNEDDVPKTKRFSFPRGILLDNHGKDRDFDISEKELRELRDLSRQAAITPFYPGCCLVR